MGPAEGEAREEAAAAGERGVAQLTTNPTQLKMLAPRNDQFTSKIWRAGS